MNTFKIYFTIIVFLFIPFFSFAQTSLVLNGQVIDKEKNTPLSYVNIGVIDTEVGTISSVDGDFILYLNESITSQSIVRFSYLGYETLDFTVAELQQMEAITIALKTDALTLTTIEIRPEPTRFKKVGTRRTNARMFSHFALDKQPNQNLGASIGRRFKIAKNHAYLEKFNFYIAGNNFEEIRFRLNVYSIKNGRPDKNLNRKDLIIKIKDMASGWMEIDLKTQNIHLEENVIIALEWIYHSEKGNGLALPMNVPAAGTHFYKYGSQDKWKRFRGMSTAMYLEYSY